MAQPDIIDLSSDNYDTTSFSYNIESVRTPRRISDDVIDQFANDHLSKHTKMHYKDFKKQNKLRQKQLINGSRKPVPIKNEDMNDQDQHMNGMKELYGEENGGYHGNSASHMSSSYFDPTPRPASSRRSKFPNYIMDNQRTPTRPGFGTPQRQGSDEDSLFIPESGEFSFDNTPSRKRRRTDHGSQQRIPPTAPMTPGSSSRNSSYHQPGLFRQQALSQKRGAGAKSFSPGGNAFITQEDLQTMVGELQGMIEKYTIGCANVATVYKELQVLKKKVQREQKENEDHMNKTMAEFFESNKKAIKDLHDRDEYLQHDIDDLRKKTGHDEVVRGGEYGGSRSVQEPRSTGCFDGMMNGDLQPFPQGSQGSPNRTGFSRSPTGREGTSS